MKHLSLLFLLGIPSLLAQQNGIDQSLELDTLPTGGNVIHWYGHTGRSYFVQVSDPSSHLTKWTWAPIIEGGKDRDISHEVGGTPNKGFFRLKYTDQIPGPGFTLDTADFDGDGLSNLDEIDPPPPLSASSATDPLNPDCDGDGFSDGFERVNGADPNNADENGDGTPDADQDLDGDDLLGRDEAAMGTKPNDIDSDDDTFNDGADAKPLEVLVDWVKSPESSLFTLEVADIPVGYKVVDMNDVGQVLFMNQEAYSYPNDTYHDTPVGAVWTPGQSVETSWKEIYFKPGAFKMKGRKNGNLVDITTASPVTDQLMQNQAGYDYGTWNRVSQVNLKAIADDGSIIGSARYYYLDLPLDANGGLDWINSTSAQSVSTFLWSGTAADYSNCKVLGDENILGSVTDYSDAYDKFWSGHFPAGFYQKKVGDVLKTFAVTEYQPRRDDGDQAAPVKVRVFDIAMPEQTAYIIDGGVKRNPINAVPFIPLPTANGRHLLRGDNQTRASKVVSETEAVAVDLDSTGVPGSGTVNFGNPLLPEILMDRPGAVQDNRWALGGVGGLRGLNESTVVKTTADLPLYGMDRNGTAIGTGTHAKQVWRNDRWIDLTQLLPGDTTVPADAFVRKITPSGLILLGTGGASPVTWVLMPVDIDDNDANAPSGVDDFSKTSDATDLGYQKDFWIMAPSGTVPKEDGTPGTTACADEVKFIVPLRPGTPLDITCPGAQATDHNIFPNRGHAPTVSWHATATASNDESPVFTLGAGQRPVTMPVRVKTMKNRMVKVAVWPVRLSLENPFFSDEPSKEACEVAIKTRLNQIIAYQTNAWFDVEVKSEQTFDYFDGRSNGFYTIRHGIKEKDMINAYRSGDVDINIYLIKDVYYYSGNPTDQSSYLVVGSSYPWNEPDSGSYGNCVVVNYNRGYADYLETIAHEIGHLMVGGGHPDKYDANTSGLGGVAPLQHLNSVDHKKRLMYSLSGSAGRLLVKTEWDEAEKWLQQFPDKRQ